MYQIREPRMFNITGNVISDIARFSNIGDACNACRAMLDFEPTPYGSLIAKVGKSFHNSDFKDIYLEFLGDESIIISGTNENNGVIRKININPSHLTENGTMLNYLFFTLEESFGLYKGVIEMKDKSCNADNEQCNDSLLSMEALAWLKSVNYAEKSHDERMKLIAAAKIAYPG